MDDANDPAKLAEKYKTAINEWHLAVMGLQITSSSLEWARTRKRISCRRRLHSVMPGEGNKTEIDVEWLIRGGLNKTESS